MGLDTARAKEKESELLTIINTVISNELQIPQQDNTTARDILKNYAQITAPENETVIFHYITASPSGRGGGKSRKLGNIRINIKNLFNAAANGVLTGVGAAQIPWLIPLAAIVIWKSIQSTMEVEVGENEAAILWTMWKHRDENTEIAHSGLLELVNLHLNKYDRSPITEGDMKHSLKVLQNLKSIEKSSKNPGNWWLREWIKRTYR